MDTIKERPNILSGKTYRLRTGCGYIYVTINSDNTGIFEVFATIGKAGGCAFAQSEAIGKLISVALRGGIKPEMLSKHLIGIACHSPYGMGDAAIDSCADAIGKAINLYLKER